MLEQTRLSHSFWHRPRRLIATRRQTGLGQQRITHIGQGPPSAFGLARNGSPGDCRVQIVSMTLSVLVWITLSVSLAALATTKYRPFGESAMAEACKPARISASTLLAARSITVTDPSLAINL